VYSKDQLKKLYFFFFIFVFSQAFTQDNCEFKSQNKKGGHYLFSTYYEDDLKTPREGVCQILHLGKIYERRTFVKGKLTEETLNTFEGNPRVRSKFSIWDNDSILIDQKVYYENGLLQTHNIYYLNQEGRRCLQTVEYGLKGQKRFERSYAWIRYSELQESDKSGHPPHTLDEEGYTYLMVPFGDELTYYDGGELFERKQHQFIKDGNHEHRSLHGPVLTYYENGKLKSKGKYKDGSLNGIFKSYFQDGKLETERYYENNVPVGEWKGWHANGQQAYWYLYDLETAHPFEPNKKEWAENGQLTLEQVLDVGANGYLREWTAAGIQTHDVDIQLLDRTKGVETWWYKDGQLHWRRDYRKGQDTSLVEFYPNGEWQRLEIHKEQGSNSYKEVKRWYPKMVLEQLFISETRADGYFKQVQEHYYPNGKFESRIEYKNKECYKEFYASNGVKIRALHTILDSLYGPYQELDSTGQLLIDYRYSAGLRDGWCREYATDGSLLFERYYKKGIQDTSYPSVDKRKALPSLSMETKQGLERLLKIQRIDSLLFSKKESEKLFELAYQHYPDLFEPLPQTDYNGFRDFNHAIRIHLRRNGQMVFMDISAYATSSVTLIIYPDMEIEIFNHRYTKDELNEQQVVSPKFYMWND
jgi:antitoxin component YwqK of YwqJK toxin-antitoxin module